MGSLTITAVVNGVTTSRTETIPDEGDAAVQAWADDAYARPAGHDPEAPPLSGADAIGAAIGGTMRGILNNVKQHAVEKAKEQAAAAAAAAVAGLEPL